ncbi:MAG: heparinase II/III family protein [Aliihoeflea sp.]|uniref:heparinase II/III family protein n=1 Tax=Aliihoeflea sp. TaxID=2608088 RepID=UPI0040343A9F
MWTDIERLPRTLQWKLHQFAFLPSLIAYDRKHNSSSGGLHSAKLLDKWWRLFSDAPRQKTNMAWHDHGTALRLQNLLLLRTHLQRSSKFLEEVCLQHGLLLMTEGFYNRGNNHGLDQSLALFECGYELERPKMHRIATGRILDEIGTAFATDGGHVENSTGYHHFGINQVKSANELAEAYTGSPIEGTGLVERAEVILAHMTRPDRRLPHIGDTQDFTVRRLPQPEETKISLPESGWAFFRSGWDTRAVHGAFKCGYLSQSHRQDDDLSLSIFGFGEEWLIDGGLFAHQPKDPMRIYMRSASAHSLPYVVGMQAIRDVSRVGNASKITGFASNPDGYEVTGVTGMWEGFEAKRTIRFDRSSFSIDIHDLIKPISTAAKNRASERANKGYAVYGTRFLAPDDKKVIRHSGGVRLVSPSAKSLHIETRLPSKILVGQSDPQILGWRSVKAGSAVAAHDISFTSPAEEFDERFCLRWGSA